MNVKKGKMLAAAESEPLLGFEQELDAFWNWILFLVIVCIYAPLYVYLVACLLGFTHKDIPMYNWWI